MPNDAKIGLVVGVGLVVIIAVVFFRREPVDASATAAAAVSPNGQDRGGPPRNQLPLVPASPASAANLESARHVVREGETLYSLARRYYHDDRKFVEIFRANQDVLTTPDPLRPGTVLVIPELPTETASPAPRGR
jgi:nucleoid-associated protein YgaU